MGPLQPFFEDPEAEEIWVNEPGKVFVAKAGRPQLTTIHHLIDAVLLPLLNHQSSLQ